MLPLKDTLLSKCMETANGLDKSIGNSCKSISASEMNEKYLKNQYPKGTIETCRSEYGLEMEKEPCFIAWPVFLGEDFHEINICAVNLGISTLVNEYSRDRDGASLDPRTKQFLDSAINTLVVTSLTEEHDGRILRFWPTHIDYTNRIEYGTIIQSVITLSTLLRIGFLDRTWAAEEKTGDDPVLRNRIRFLMEAVDWLVYLDEISDPVNSAWSYAEECIEAGSDHRIKSAILPSEQSFEVLSNYRRLFSENAAFRAIVEALDPDFFTRISSVCENYQLWFMKEQFADGGFRENSNQEQPSFAYSCCALLFFSYADLSEESCMNSLKKLIGFLYSDNRSFQLPFQEVCDAYKFRYRVEQNEGYVNDAYEIFPEAILFLGSSALLSGHGAVIPRGCKRRLRQLNYRCLESMLYRVRKIEVGRTGKNTVILGRNEAQGFHFPIYAIFYVKCCLASFLRNESLPKKEKVALISLPRLFDLKTIVLTAVLISLVGLACYISFQDTITSIILSIVSLLAAFLIKLIIGETHWLDKK